MDGRPSLSPRVAVGFLKRKVNIAICFHFCVNDYEKDFAKFLKRCSDVRRFASLGTTEQESGAQFRVDYLKPEFNAIDLSMLRGGSFVLRLSIAVAKS